MIQTEVFAKAAVAAPHHLAVESGKKILSEGGNAIEAMLAMAATIAVVYPHMNSLGGDGFWLIREPAGRIFYIEACGYAGAGASLERYRDLGHSIVPRRGPLAALTIPGTVGGFILAHQLAKAAGGRLPLTDLLRDAMDFAKTGYPQSQGEARAAPLEFAALQAAPGFAESFLVDGKIPSAGTLRRNPKLAETLHHLSRAGLEDFYRGDIGREIAADMERIGAPSTREDLVRFRAVMREPLSLSLEGRTHFNAPPPTQGLASLYILGLFARLGINKAESFEHIHGLVEASKRALALRDRVCTAFEYLTHDPTEFLTPAFLAREAAAIRFDRAAPYPLAETEGDTVWMGAIDAAGRAVSFIQSVYWEYGSGCVLPQTGILLQNRGCAFSLDPKSRNPLMPGRRPPHTLNPALTTFDDGRIMAHGSMGGDGQPQFQAQVFTRYLLGNSLAAAIDAPRFLFGKLWGAESETLKLEPRFDDGLISRLRAVGHDIELASEPYSSRFGHAGSLIRHASGRIEAAHDPRSDGGSAGF
ncbi:MAG: gamma-glutamyltransferase family protein [Beijerinckiaceae bacterium]